MARLKIPSDDELTDEQKAALNAKYGKLETPTVEDMHKTISAASDCRLS